MNLNAASLRILLAKGMTLEDVADFVAAKERTRDLTGAERQRRCRAKAKGTPNGRKGTSWRNRVFVQLIARDGSHCIECGEGERTIWRKAGFANNDDWGWCEDGRAVSQYSAVNPSSNLEVEHTVPLSEGGTNDLENLRLLCVECHKVKTSAERSSRLKKLFSEGRQ